MIRTSFVSNSSSSNFIVIGKRPNKQLINSIKLTKEVASILTKRNKIKWDGKKSVYLTGFLHNDYLEDGHIYLEGDIYFFEENVKEYVNLNEDPSFSEDNPIFIYRGDLDKNFNKRKFISKVKKLAKDCDIKYKLEII